MEKAENVQCDVEDFQLGLVVMWHCIKERLDMEDIDPTDPDVLEQLEG